LLRRLCTGTDTREDLRAADIATRVCLCVCVCCVCRGVLLAKLELFFFKWSKL
jgi:hypothetical protein